MAALAGAALAVALLPHHAEAAEYWVASSPVGGQAGDLGVPAGFEAAVINTGAAVDIASLNKVDSSGISASTQTVPVPPKSTGLLEWSDSPTTSQISNVGINFVSTQAQLEVRQLISVGSQGNAELGSGSDATRVLPATMLGKSYTVLTNGNPPGVWIPPGRDWFTVISIKSGTVVQVWPSGYTASSGGSAILPTYVPAMNGAGPYTYTLSRGYGLHVQSSSLDSPDCILGGFPGLLGGAGGPCGSSDLSGSKIQCSTACAVFVGNDCWGPTESLQPGSTVTTLPCDVLGQEMLPDELAGSTFVLCTGNRPYPDHTADMNLLRISAPTGATVNFGVPVKSSYAGPASIYSSAIAPGKFKQFYMDQDTVVTTSAPVAVEAYIEVALGDGPGPNNPASPAQQLIYAWGGPAQVSITPLDSAKTDHWLYSFAGFDNHLVIGAKLGTALLDDTAFSGNSAHTVSGFSLQPIGTTGYGCGTFDDSSTTPNTHQILTTGPAVVQMVGVAPGLAVAATGTAYWYDSGGNPPTAPAPAPPTAAFKPTTSPGCGMHPITFQDGSTAGGSPLAQWLWDFGDGSQSTMQDPTHMYAASGDYYVTETVMDSSGLTGVYSTTITVTEGPACIIPQIPQDNGFAPRPPHDGVDAGMAESDMDGDGVLNAVGNCPTVANADQSDMDGDHEGDLCDPDMDNDGFMNAADNCPVKANPTQADLNVNGKGDACEPDMDGDGVLNIADNCPTAANTDQTDSDGNGVGDACDRQRFVSPAGPVASASARSAPASLSVPQTSRTAWLALMLGSVVAAALVGLALLVILRRR